ncbi:MAG: condensation domain-containing protein, partial [Syntrophobacteraceae bacterium]
VSAFKRAWQLVLDRHPILRTFFIWEGRDKPLQIVRERVDLPWDEWDWRSLTSEEQEVQGKAYLESDRRRGFTLSKAPLMRFLLIHLADNKFQFIWSHHHLLLDGWSFALLFKEVSAIYEAFSREQQPGMELVRPYRDFIAWIQRQDLSEAQAFWREMLKGFASPTDLGINSVYGALPDTVQNHEEQQIVLSAATTEKLESMVRKNRLTLNNLVQGAWALLLSRYSGEDDVVFGTVSSGRPVALKGAETMVGLFISTLPMRVRMSPEMPCLDWLRRVQDQQIEIRQYEYSPLSRIQEWSEVPRGIPLFETILAFENYPADEYLKKPLRDIDIHDIRFIERTNYPICVQASPGSELTLKISYDCNRFQTDTITRMLGHFKTLLKGIAADPPKPSAINSWSNGTPFKQITPWMGVCMSCLKNR